MRSARIVLRTLRYVIKKLTLCVSDCTDKRLHNALEHTVVHESRDRSTRGVRERGFSVFWRPTVIRSTIGVPSALFETKYSEYFRNFFFPKLFVGVFGERIFESVPITRARELWREKGLFLPL